VAPIVIANTTGVRLRVRTVTPRIRDQVFARDHHRCTAPGYRSARNLEIHHIIEQANGAHTSFPILVCCAMATMPHYSVR